MASGKKNARVDKHPAVLMLSNEECRRVLDDSPVYVSAFLPDGTLTYVNNLLARATGKTADDLLGKSFFDMLPPDEAKKVRKRLSSLSPEQPATTQTQLYTSPDGGKRWQQWNNRAFFDENGVPVHYVAMGQDITERKLADDRIRHLSSFPELNPNPVMEINSGGEVTFANPAAVKVLENSGKDRTDIAEYLPADLKEILRRWDGTAEQIFNREVQVADRIFSETIHLIPGFGVARIYANDISWQKESDRLLKVSEENYRCFANLTSDSLLKCSRTGTAPYRIEWIGGSAGSISGYSAEEILATGCILPLVHGDDRQNVTAELHGMVPGEVKIIEFRIVTKEGKVRWIAEKCRCEKGEGEGELLLFASVRDITVRKEMEENLQLTYRELQRHDSQMVILNRMNELLLSVESREEAYAIIGGSAEKLFSPNSGGLAIYHEESSACRVVAYWGDEIGTSLTFPMSDCWAMRQGVPHKVCDPEQFLGCRHYQGRRDFPHFCLPIIIRGQTLGLLQVIASHCQAAQEVDALYNLAITMRESISLALSNLLLHETLRMEAIHDPLTGLFNRRYLEETLTLELRNHQRNKAPLTVAMLDLDHFKSYNDEYGHEAGDLVLTEIGALLLRSLRGGDIACRYGGEELTVILTGSTLMHALPRLDSIRQMIRDLRIHCRNRELPAVTVSIGIAEARPDEAEAATILRRADAALYQAKQEGRNRIVSA